LPSPLLPGAPHAVVKLVDLGVGSTGFESISMLCDLGGVT
jgi:hypothetical protein